MDELAYNLFAKQIELLFPAFKELVTWNFDGTKTERFSQTYIQKWCCYLIPDRSVQKWDIFFGLPCLYIIGNRVPQIWSKYGIFQIDIVGVKLKYISGRNISGFIRKISRLHLLAEDLKYVIWKFSKSQNLYMGQCSRDWNRVPSIQKLSIGRYSKIDILQYIAP